MLEALASSIAIIDGDTIMDIAPDLNVEDAEVFDALARLETNHRAAAQGAGHGGLRDPREKRDVE